MPDETPRKTRIFRWVKSPDYQTRSVEGATVELNTNGTIYLNFYVVRPQIEKMHEYELLGNNELGELVREEDVDEMVFEVQHGILLNTEDARDLRDELNKILEEDEDEDEDEDEREAGA